MLKCFTKQKLFLPSNFKLSNHLFPQPTSPSSLFLLTYSLSPSLDKLNASLYFCLALCWYRKHFTRLNSNYAYIQAMPLSGKRYWLALQKRLVEREKTLLVKWIYAGFNGQNLSLSPLKNYRKENFSKELFWFVDLFAHTCGLNQATREQWKQHQHNEILEKFDLF